MLNREQRRLVQEAMLDTGLTRQAWLATLLRDADHGDEESQERLKLFCRVYKKTRSSKHAQAAVDLKYNQLTLED